MASTGVSKDGLEATVLRQFGINETYQLAMYLQDQYRGTVLSCRYAVPPRLAAEESLTQLKETVKMAVVDTIMRHPMLQVAMMDVASKTPSWIQLQRLDLTEHVKWLHLEVEADFEQTVQQVFAAQLDDRFPDLSIKQPGWKVTLIRQGSAPSMEVMLTWNHPHFDGLGARAFHEDFLDSLNAANGAHERAGLDGDILGLSEVAPLLPAPIENLKSLPVDLKHLATAFWQDTRPQFLNRDVSYASWCPIRTSPYKTRFRAFFVHNASLVAILALCRQNKTTLTGLFNGLLLLAFASHLSSTAAPAFQSSTIVDHRRHLPRCPPNAPWGQTSSRVMSNYVTQVLHRYDTKRVAQIRSQFSPAAGTSTCSDLSTDLRRELWAAAAVNRREMERKLDAGLRNDLVGVFKHVTDWQQTMRAMARKTRQFSWIVTNIGVLDGKVDDGGQRWSIGRAQFGLSAEVPAAAIEVSPVSVAGRGMCVGASWLDCAVDAKLGQSIMADLERWLGQLVARQA